jgi:hypothetical protein
MQDYALCEYNYKMSQVHREEKGSNPCAWHPVRLKIKSVNPGMGVETESVFRNHELTILELVTRRLKQIKSKNLPNLL